ATIAPGLTLAGKAHAITGVDPGRNLHCEVASAPYPPLPQAGIARVAHDGAGAAATWAGLLQLEEPLCNAHLTGTAARVARGGRPAFGTPAPMAPLALGEPCHLDLDLVAEHRLRQVELERVAQVGAAKHLMASRAAGVAEDVSEDVTEDVTEGV